MLTSSKPPTAMPPVVAPSRKVAVTFSIAALFGAGGCANGCGHSNKTSDLVDAAQLASLYPPDAPPDDPNDHRFQGIIETDIGVMTDEVGKENNESLSFNVKGDAYRWDILERSVARGDYRVYDRSAHRFYTVLTSEGLILASPESNYLVDSGGGDIPRFDLVDDHKAGNVQGHACESYHVDAPPFRYEVCASNEFIPLPFHMMPGLYQATIPFGGELVDRALFPLTVSKLQMPDGGAATTTVSNGKQVANRGQIVSSFRVRRIEAKRIDPSIFHLPKYEIRKTPLLQTTGKLLH